MSRDGLLPKLFADIHKQYGTPFKSNILLCVFICLFAGFAPIHIVGEMTSIGTLLAFILVSTGVLILRKTQPDVHRPFKTPFGPNPPGSEHHYQCNTYWYRCRSIPGCDSLCGY